MKKVIILASMLLASQFSQASERSITCKKVELSPRWGGASRVSVGSKFMITMDKEKNLFEGIIVKEDGTKIPVISDENGENCSIQFMEGTGNGKCLDVAQSCLDKNGEKKYYSWLRITDTNYILGNSYTYLDGTFREETQYRLGFPLTERLYGLQNFITDESVFYTDCE